MDDTPSKSAGVASPTIDDVRRFWDSSPLGVGFIPGSVGSLEWYAEFDRLKKNVGLVGVLDQFAPASLRGQRVLDVGCGPGFWARHLIPMGVDYTGVDLSPRSAELATRSIELLGLKGTIQVANAESLPFESGTFDAVVSEGVIHHTPRTETCIREIYRVLKPGGRAAVSVYYRVALLRSPGLFRAARPVMKLFGVSLPGRGREGMADAGSPDAFVRMYDGLDNPVGKAYTKPELRTAFEEFTSIEFHRYFLPYQRPLAGLSRSIHRALSRFGLMMLVVAQK